MYQEVTRQVWNIISALMAILLLSSCASEPSRFYLLNPVAYSDEQPATRQQPAQVIGIERIDLPDYLQQPQMVLRLSAHELHRDEFNRWAEPLQNNMQSVLAQNITLLTPNVRVVTAPWKSRDSIDQIVHLTVMRFDTDEYGVATLAAKWEILDEATRQVRASDQKIYTATATMSDYNAITAALNNNFDQLSRDIAASL